jgi:hypothetical protein
MSREKSAISIPRLRRVRVPGIQYARAELFVRKHGTRSAVPCADLAQGCADSAQQRRPNPADYLPPATWAQRRPTIQRPDSRLLLIPAHHFRHFADATGARRAATRSGTPIALGSLRIRSHPSEQEPALMSDIRRSMTGVLTGGNRSGVQFRPAARRREFTLELWSRPRLALGCDSDIPVEPPGTLRRALDDFQESTLTGRIAIGGFSSARLGRMGGGALPKEIQ